MPTTKDQVILEVWNRSGRDIVSASDLTQINAALAQHFGSESSPASIARVLADHGARLSHPEILQTDLRWRESDLLFSAEDLTLDNMDAAVRLMDKIDRLRRGFENQAPALEHLYKQIRQIKSELQLVGTSLARELAQWLTVWLQNPGIFNEWLGLRRTTDEFRERFGS